jgi:hypothetical protein
MSTHADTVAHLRAALDHCEALRTALLAAAELSTQTEPLLRAAFDDTPILTELGPSTPS